MTIMMPKKKTIFKAGTRGGIGFCVDTVVKNALKIAAPPSTQLKARIIYRLGTLSISAATSHIVGKQFDEMIDSVDDGITMWKAMKAAAEEFSKMPPEERTQEKAEEIINNKMEDIQNDGQEDATETE